MYDELVKMLRKRAVDWVSQSAADAIEELLKAAKAMHTWIFLNSLDEQAAYDECGLTDEMNAALGYGGQFVAESPKEESLDNSEPETKQEYYQAFCSRCGRPVIAKKEEAFWWPGGTTDDHLCISCDVCGGLAEV